MPIRAGPGQADRFFWSMITVCKSDQGWVFQSFPVPSSLVAIVTQGCLLLRWLKVDHYSRCIGLNQFFHRRFNFGTYSKHWNYKMSVVFWHVDKSECGECEINYEKNWDKFFLVNTAVTLCTYFVYAYVFFVAAVSIRHDELQKKHSLNPTLELVTGQSGRH